MIGRLIVVTALGASLLIGVPAQAATVETSPESTSASEQVRAAFEAGRVNWEWRDCPEENPLPGFECATLTVPRDWDDLANPLTAEIAVAVRPRDGAIGAYTFNPGGPGGSGLLSAEAVRDGLPPRVRDSFDFVAWDPRGVGATRPLLTGCPAVPDSPGLPATGPVDWADYVESTVSALAPATEACLAANPDVAPFLGTYYVIRDLEAMRIALGYDQWTFHGMSYGTRVGFQYARAFPSSVRALLQDGSMSPNETVTSLAGNEAWNWAWSTGPFNAVTGRQAKLDRITAELDVRTVTIDGTVYTRWEILGRIYSGMGRQINYPAMVEVIDTTYAALFGTPNARSERRFARDLEAIEADESGMAYLFPTVMCSDLRGWPTEGEVASLAKSAAVNNSVHAGALAAEIGTSCAGFPPGFGKPFAFRQKPLALPTAPVVLNALGDPRTSWAWARTMANMLIGTPMISYEGTQHVVYARTFLRSECVDDAVDSYLIDLTVPTSRTCPYVASPEPGERGTITWSDCTDDSMVDWRCGKLTVPLDWDNLANPRNAEIAFALKPSLAPDRIGAFTYNPGGPGGDGISGAMRVRELLPPEVRERFDFVAWDPRGVGESSPWLQGCTLKPSASRPPATGPIAWGPYVHRFVERLIPARSDCFEKNKDIAPYLGTYYVIRDLDALRAALREEQWTYWGMSYGTRIGLRYARQFPTRLRAFLLDGSVAPNETMLTRSGQTAYKYGHVNATFTAAMGGDMPAKYGRVVRALNERPVTLDGREYTRWMIFPRIYGNIGRQVNFPSIKRVIDEVYAGLFGGEASARRLDRALRQLDEGPDRTSQSYLIDMVNCADAQTWPTVAQVVDVVSTAARVSSNTGAMDSLGRSSHCFGLPEGFAPSWPALTRPIELPTPPIVIQSYGDPATAWIGGRQMSEFFVGGSFISYTGTQHVTYMRTPSECINDPVTRYLLTLEVPSSRTCDYVPS